MQFFHPRNFDGHCRIVIRMQGHTARGETREASIIAAYFLLLTSQYSTDFSFRPHQKT